jgi:hypothetical protein
MAFWQFKFNTPEFTGEGYSSFTKRRASVQAKCVATEAFLRLTESLEPDHHDHVHQSSTSFPYNQGTFPLQL